jgi:hypothetical protein
MQVRGARGMGSLPIDALAVPGLVCDTRLVPRTCCVAVRTVLPLARLAEVLP